MPTVRVTIAGMNLELRGVRTKGFRGTLEMPPEPAECFVEEVYLITKPGATRPEEGAPDLYPLIEYFGGTDDLDEKFAEALKGDDTCHRA